jgi:hypothetical protein
MNINITPCNPGKIQVKMVFNTLLTWICNYTTLNNTIENNSEFPPNEPFDIGTSIELKNKSHTWDIILTNSGTDEDKYDIMFEWYCLDVDNETKKIGVWHKSGKVERDKLANRISDTAWFLKD